MPGLVAITFPICALAETVGGAGQFPNILSTRFFFGHLGCCIKYLQKNLNHLPAGFVPPPWGYGFAPNLCASCFTAVRQRLETETQMHILTHEISIYLVNLKWRFTRCRRRVIASIFLFKWGWFMFSFHLQCGIFKIWPGCFIHRCCGTT